MYIPLDANNDRSAFPSENFSPMIQSLDSNQAWDTETRGVSYPPIEYDNEMSNSYDPYQTYKDDYNSQEMIYGETPGYTETTRRPYNAATTYFYPSYNRPYPDPSYEQGEADDYSPYYTQEYSTTPRPYQSESSLYTSTEPYFSYEQNEVDDYSSYPPQQSTTTKRPYYSTSSYLSQTQGYENSYTPSYSKPSSSYLTSPRPMYNRVPQYSTTTRRPAYQTTPGYQARPYSSTPSSYYPSSPSTSYPKKPQNSYSTSPRPSTYSVSYNSNVTTQRPAYSSSTPCPYHKRPSQPKYPTTTKQPYKQMKSSKPYGVRPIYQRIPPAKPAMRPVYTVNRRPQPLRYNRRPYGRMY